MKKLPHPIEFEWDEGNRDKNLIKHKVTTNEAEEVFANDPKFITEAKILDEERYQLLGITKNKRTLTIIFTTRGSKIRVISAPSMSVKERRRYAQEIKKHSRI